MNDSHFSFASLISPRDEFEESFWPSFTDIMMVITMIFLLVTVAVVLSNTRLLDELRHSVLAEQSAQQEAQKAALEAAKAAQQAEFQLKANATLEEQLDYLQQRSSSLEMELLRSRAETEEIRNVSNAQSTDLERLQVLSREQADTIASREKTLDDLQQQFVSIMAERERAQTELTAALDSVSTKDTELTSLRSKVDQSEKQLLSLRGDYTELDKKYQKLLKPARSAKGKQVVEVVYRKSGYAIRRPGDSTVRSVNRTTLETELSALKGKYAADLYVKVIIPSDSGLSYNEAWRFTSEMLSKYDYYSGP